MFSIISGIIALGVAVAILCWVSAVWAGGEGDRRGLISALIVATLIFTVIGRFTLVTGIKETLTGYPAPKKMLWKNSVYEVVTSFEDKDQSYAAVREPDGSIRLFYTDQTLEKGFFKATVPNGKSSDGIILVPLITHTVHVEFVMPELAPKSAATQKP